MQHALPEPAAQPDEDFALAFAHRPVLMLDRAEPFLPLVYGYTVQRERALSPSSKFMLDPPSGGGIIEYAVWYDWDIQHLYDLEHVWVHINRGGAIVRVEGSMHGLRVSIDTGSGLPEIRDTRPVLFVEPGTHALWGVDRQMLMIAGAVTDQLSGPQAEVQGVHSGNLFAESGAYQASAKEHRLARLALQKQAFEPTYEFEKSSDDHPPILIPWANLAAWIPTRVNALVAALETDIPHLKSVFLDCGDTLIDERTEEKIPGSEVVVKAAFIPGAQEAVRALHEAGYHLVLVADGPRATFENVLRPSGLWELFSSHIISQDIGELKPSAKMFDAALSAASLTREEAGHVVMVGNNLARDIRGANALGIQSIFMRWSTLRKHEPTDALEKPDHTIENPSALFSKLAEIELSLVPNFIGAADG
jgi:putative hydrolase of the HAD superfamily